jgi:hypothetical protein
MASENPDSYVSCPVGKSKLTLERDIAKLGLTEKIVGPAARIHGEDGIAIKDGSRFVTRQFADLGYRVVLNLVHLPLAGSDGSIFYVYPYPHPGHQRVLLNRQAKAEAAAEKEKESCSV